MGCLRIFDALGVDDFDSCDLRLLYFALFLEKGLWFLFVRDALQARLSTAQKEQAGNPTEESKPS